MKYGNPFRAPSTDAASEQTLKGALTALENGPIRFKRNRVIACEGDSADYVFHVVSGVIRSCKTFKNGERAVVAFYLPGDLFGWDYGSRPLSIEAASDARVMLIKRQALMALAEQNTRLVDLLHSAITKELRRAQEHAATISISAKDRFLTFLNDFIIRLGTSGPVRLPMAYQDIADHLGIKIESLSRTITELENAGTLARSARGTLSLKKFPLI